MPPDIKKVSLRITRSFLNFYRRMCLCVVTRHEFFTTIHIISISF